MPDEVDDEYSFVSSSRCVEDTQSDYVEFSNFYKTIDRKMNRLCGNSESNQKRTVSSDSHFFRVTFKSNNVYDATGFQAHYQFRSVKTTGKYTRKGWMILTDRGCVLVRAECVLLRDGCVLLRKDVCF